MKITMFVYNNCLHDARVLKEAKALAEKGHEVKILAVLDASTTPFEEKDCFKIFRVKKLFNAIKIQQNNKDTGATNNLNSESSSVNIINHMEKISDWRRKILLAFYRPFAFLNYYVRAWSIIKNKPADVYHCHDLNTLLLGYLAKQKNNAKLIYDAHELSTELAYIPWHEKFVWKKLERFLIHRVDQVITPGIYRAKYFIEKYKVTMPEVIINCPTRIEQEKYRNYLREQTGMENKEPLILYQGGLIRGRGLHNLIMAMQQVDRGILVFMGWGIIENELKNLSKQCNLQKRVFFITPVAPEQVVEYIASADLGVVIYRFTGLNNYYASPNKLYEYINAGLPVISSNFPALQEIIDEYELGITFDPEDPNSIAASINKILSDSTLYKIYKHNAEKAAKIFNWENESMKLIEIYNRLDS